MKKSNHKLPNLLVKDCSHCGGHHSIIFIQLLEVTRIQNEEFTHAGVCPQKGGGLVYAKDGDPNNVYL